MQPEAADQNTVKKPHTASDGLKVMRASIAQLEAVMAPRVTEEIE